MLLKVEKSFNHFCYEVKTETKEILYHLEQKLTFFSEVYQVFDKEHQRIAEIKKNKKRKSYELIENKKIIDEITITSDGLKYKLNNQWTVETTEKDKKYIIYDELHREIAYIKFILEEELWTIEIIDSENIKLVMIILTVLIATNEVNQCL